MNPPQVHPCPTSWNPLSTPSSWVVPVHQPQWCFWTVVLEKTLKSPLDCKGIKPVNPKGNQSILIGRTDDEAEMPILWPSDAKNWLIGKASDVGKDWRQDEKGMTEDEIVGCITDWMALRLSKLWELGDGQESLACCSPWGHKELYTTEQLTWTELNFERNI